MSNYTIVSEKCIRMKTSEDGGISFVWLVHIVADSASDIPEPTDKWEVGSRCDVLEDGGHVYELSNGREWVEVNFFDRISEGDSTDLSNYYTKSQTDEKISEKVAEIVADAPEDFDTLKEMSDWIASHKDSAAAMNTAINQKVDKVSGMGLSQNSFTTAEKTKLAGLENYDDSELKAKMAINKSSIGLQKKNRIQITALSNDMNGLTFTINSDGSVHVEGTATKSTYFPIGKVALTAGEKIILTGADSSSTAAYIDVYIGDGANPVERFRTTYTYPKEVKNSGNFIVRINVLSETTIDTTFYPMLRCAEIEDDTYEPYVDDLQTQLQKLMDRVTALESKQNMVEENL